MRVRCHSQGRSASAIHNSPEADTHAVKHTYLVSAMEQPTRLTAIPTGLVESYHRGLHRCIWPYHLEFGAGTSDAKRIAHFAAKSSRSQEERGSLCCRRLPQVNGRRRWPDLTGDNMVRRKSDLLR